MKLLLSVFFELSNLDFLEVLHDSYKHFIQTEPLDHISLLFKELDHSLLDYVSFRLFPQLPLVKLELHKLRVVDLVRLQVHLQHFAFEQHFYLEYLDHVPQGALQRVSVRSFLTPQFFDLLLQGLLLLL